MDTVIHVSTPQLSSSVVPPTSAPNVSQAVALELQLKDLEWLQEQQRQLQDLQQQLHQPSSSFQYTNPDGNFGPPQKPVWNWTFQLYKSIYVYSVHPTYEGMLNKYPMLGCRT